MLIIYHIYDCNIFIVPRMRDVLKSPNTKHEIQLTIWRLAIVM